MKQLRMSAGFLVRGKEGKHRGGVRMRWRETLPPAFQEARGVPCSPGRRKRLAGLKGPGFPVVSSPLRPLPQAQATPSAASLTAPRFGPGPTRRSPRGGLTGPRLGDSGLRSCEARLVFHLSVPFSFKSSSPRRDRSQRAVSVATYITWVLWRSLWHDDSFARLR